MTNEAIEAQQAQNFNAPISGATTPRKDIGGSLMVRRTLRRGRRANRAI